MQTRAVRSEARARRSFDSDTRAQLLAVEPSEVLFRKTPRAIVVEHRLDPLGLSWGGDRRQRPTLHELGVDPLLRGNSADFVDGGEQRPLHRDRGVAPVAAGDLGPGRREQTGAPPPVAPRRAEPRHVLFDDRDAHVGLSAQEVVGRPEPRVSGPDDCDVDVGITRQRGARVQVVVDAVKPQAVEGVVLCPQGVAHQ
jgi:hypothetical protein